MPSYGTAKRIEENKQTTLSAQKNANFSSQRFSGVEKGFREGIQLYALKNLFFFHSASMNEQQRTTRSNNKGDPNYSSLQDKTKIDKQQQ